MEKSINNNVYEKIDSLLANAIDEFINYLKNEKRYSLNTVYAYKSDLEIFLMFLAENNFDYKFGIWDLKNLTRFDFRAFLAKMHSDNITKTSIARKISSIKTFFKFGKKFQNLENDELLLIKINKINKTLPRPIGEVDLWNILKEIENTNKTKWIMLRNKTMLMVIYGLGLRISEAIALNIGDVSRYSDNYTIKILGKGKKQRILPVIPELSAIIKIYLDVIPVKVVDEDPLFFAEKNLKLKKRVSPRIFQRLIEKIRYQHNLADTVTPHAIRHSFASHLLKNGGNIRTIQSALGHSSLKATQKYLQIDMENMREAQKKFHPRG
jgi:integrase/recombinase XerC